MTLRRTLRAGGAGVIRRLRRAGCYCRRATERIDPSWWVLSGPRCVFLGMPPSRCSPGARIASRTRQATTASLHRTKRKRARLVIGESVTFVEELR